VEAPLSRWDRRHRHASDATCRLQVWLMDLAIVCTVAASWYLVGLSVTVGLVTYPSFARVGDADWVSFHGPHRVRISWAVGGAWAAQVLGLIGVI
jgi:hypothetical protein